MNKKYQIAVEDSLSGKKVIVDFKDKVVYDACRRSEWKIENDDHKHAEKESPFSSLIGGENGAFENFDEFRNDDLNPEPICLRSEENQQLYIAISSLPFLEKQVIILLFFRNLSAPQIGKLLGITEQAVNKRKRKAFVQLNIILGNYINI